MSLEELKNQLAKKYLVIEFIDLCEYRSMDELYLKLLELKKETYQDNERIVLFYDENFTETLNLVREMLVSIDIPDFFVFFQPGSTQQINSLNFSLSQSHCIYPWINLQIDSLGDLRPCCIYDGNILDNNNQKYLIQNNDLQEIYSSNYMKNLRASFLQGKKPKECKHCWDHESANIPSMRQLAHSKFKEIYYKINYHNEDFNDLQLFDLRLGNSCNLACRICGPVYSSKIADADLSAGRLNKPDYIKIEKAIGWADDDVFWGKLLTKINDIKYLDIFGGEPLMSKSHFKLLRKLIELDAAKNIKIDYNSNGTIFSEKFFDLWDHFKEIKISFSIDNIGSRFEYERYGADWNTVEENIKKFNARRSNKFITDVSTAVSIQNVYYLPELLEWINTQQFSIINATISIVRNPWFMSISSMTKEAKDLVIEKLSQYSDNEIIKPVIQTIKNSTTIKSAKDFINFMKILDSERQENFTKTHPEIAKAMRYD